MPGVQRIKSSLLVEPSQPTAQTTEDQWAAYENGVAPVTQPSAYVSVPEPKQSRLQHHVAPDGRNADQVRHVTQLPDVTVARRDREPPPEPKRRRRQYDRRGKRVLQPRVTV